MFTFESALASYAQGVKHLNSFVTNTDVRKHLDTLADKQVEFATKLHDTGTQVAKTVQEHVCKHNPFAK